MTCCTRFTSIRPQGQLFWPYFACKSAAKRGVEVSFHSATSAAFCGISSNVAKRQAGFKSAQGPDDACVLQLLNLDRHELTSNAVMATLALCRARARIVPSAEMCQMNQFRRGKDE